MNKLTFKIFLLILPVVTSANINEIKKDISKCYNIQNSVKQLECYDKLAIKHNIAKQITKSLSTSNKWKVSEEVDPLSDSTVITFFNKSTTAKSHLNRPVYLVIRCDNQKRPEFYINWQQYLGSKTYLNWRFDKEKVEDGTWNLSSDSKASFFPTYSGIEKFVYKFTKYDKYVARTTPYKDNPITAEFDISSFGEVVKKYERICRIDKMAKLEAKEKAHRKKLKKVAEYEHELNFQLRVHENSYGEKRKKAKDAILAYYDKLYELTNKSLYKEFKEDFLEELED